jgi:hypothetical protein
LFWKGDAWDFSISNNENVSESGSEDRVVSILKGDDINLSWLGDDVGDNSDSSLIVTVGGKDEVTDSLLVEINDGSSHEVVLNSISIVDGWVGESQSSGIVSDGVWDFVWTNELLDDFAEFNLYGIRLVLVDFLKTEKIAG